MELRYSAVSGGAGGGRAGAAADSGPRTAPVGAHGADYRSGELSGAASARPAMTEAGRCVQSRYSVGRFTFRSDFDSGNLAGVDVAYMADPGRGPGQSATDLGDGLHGPPGTAPLFQLYVSADCQGTRQQNKYRMWYFFSLSGHTKGETLYFRIMVRLLRRRVALHCFR